MALKDFAPLVPFVGELANIPLTEGQNRKSRRFSREMYERQKADSIAFWNMQNEYNSPAAQMRRLKDAGLNPALVYGNGAEAMSSSQPRVPSAQGAQFSVPQVNTMGMLEAYNDTRMRDKQLELLDANIVRTYAEADQTGYKNDVLSQTIDDAVRQKRADMITSENRTQLDAMAIEIQKDMLRNNVPLKGALLDLKYKELKNARTDVDVAKVNEEIRKIKTDTRLKQMDVDLRNMLNGLPGGEAVKLITSILSIIFK